MKVVAFLPKGLEEAGACELESLGACIIRTSSCNIELEADLACFYRLHLQARLPFRFLREISRFRCNSKESLYYSIQNALDWENWIDPSKSFRVDVSGFADSLKHSHFTALQVKNALIDLQRSIWGERSNINIAAPDICFHLHLYSNNAILSLDSSANSLHRRGYRSAMGIAPIKENVAAGLIKITNWDAKIPLVDPFCGSGTFLLEAASIAKGFAPGINRSFLFKNWQDFDYKLWNLEKVQAQKQCSPNKKLPQIIGCEENIDVVQQAKINILNAGLEDDIEVQQGHFRDFQFPESPGIIVCNPPYGKRIGNNEELKSMYKELGSFFKTKASGWNLWLLNGNRSLSVFLGMKSSRRFPVSNGGIDCRWLNYQIH